MKKEISALIDLFLSDSETEIYFGLNLNDEIILQNDRLKIQFKIYMDKLNVICFQFGFFNKKRDYLNFSLSPIYREKDFNYAVNIVNKIISSYDCENTKFIKDANKYIKIFKKALRKESLPNNFSVKIKENRIELIEKINNKEIILYIENKDIDLFFDLLSKKTEFGIGSLRIYGYPEETESKKIDKIIYFNILKEDIKNIPLLNNRIKIPNEDYVVTNYSDFLDVLKDSEKIFKQYVEAPDINKFLESLKLNQDLSKKTLRAKKVKI